MSPYGFDQGVLTGVAIRKRNNARVNQFEFLEVFSARGEEMASMLTISCAAARWPDFK